MLNPRGKRVRGAYSAALDGGTTHLLVHRSHVAAGPAAADPSKKLAHARRRALPVVDVAWLRLVVQTRRPQALEPFLLPAG